MSKKNESVSLPKNPFLQTLTFEVFSLALRLCISWVGLGIALVCLTVVFGHYLASLFQVVRWPTKIYFVIALVSAFISRKWSTSLLVFSLPLLPNLHVQLEFLLHPKVKYFVAYPGFDVIAGFCLGKWLRSVVIERKKITAVISPPPWPLSFLLIILTASTSVAIARNLWQSAAVFSVPDLLSAALNFKLISRLNDYYPLVDLMAYALAALLFTCLLKTLKTVPNKDDIVFKPIIVGLVFAAGWGILQGLTAFGLSNNTLEYRTDIFGFGAQGFQPDTHAYAAQMMIGTIGLIGYALSRNSQHISIISFGTGLVCWVAIILSKSRVSLLLSAFVASCFIAWLFLNKRFSLRSRLIFAIIVLLMIACLMLMTNNITWLKHLAYQIKGIDFSNAEILNTISRDRYELHRAAIRMWSDFPLFGVGNGNFFRLSAIREFSHSVLMHRVGGENAHNYFLQTLTEVGLVGSAGFALVLVWPVTKVKNLSILYPVLFAIFAMFCGNIYSHPLLIRENLFLLTVFTALLYSYVDQAPVAHQAPQSQQHHLSLTKIVTACLVGTGGLVLLYFLQQEVTSSFYKLPFESGRLHDRRK